MASPSETSQQLLMIAVCNVRLLVLVVVRLSILPLATATCSHLARQGLALLLRKLEHFRRGLVVRQ